MAKSHFRWTNSTFEEFLLRGADGREICRVGKYHQGTDAAPYSVRISREPAVYLPENFAGIHYAMIWVEKNAAHILQARNDNLRQNESRIPLTL